MSHKTMIDGVAYEIGGGKTLVNGTAYSIDKGKTLVGGTAYEVGFGPAMATITVTGEGLESNVYIIYINKELGYPTYTSPATFTANVGDVISCSIIECWSSQAIYLNDEEIAGGYGENDVYYDYVVTKDATIELYHNGASEKRSRSAIITITEE